MNEPQAARWLIDQLPKLVAEGVLNEGTAESLRSHYATLAGSSTASRNITVIIFSLLGGLLVSAGIISLFAHNWDQLGRPARTVLAFLPLVCGSILSAFAIRRKNYSSALAEGAGALHSVAIGACIALVAQIYQLSGSFDRFLLTWMLLALPLAYLLRSTTVSIVYVAGITTWAGNLVMDREPMFWCWPLLGLALPHYWGLIQENRFSGRAWWMSLALALAIPVSAGFQCDRAVFLLWPFVFSGIFTSLYLVGCGWFRKPEAPRLGHPFIFIGQFGIVALTIWLSYRFAWSRPFMAGSAGLGQPAWIIANIIGYGFLILAVILFALGWMRKIRMNPVAGLLPVVILGGTFLLHTGIGWTLGLMNLYALALGVVTIVRGTRDLRFTSLNAGLFLVAALIISRFFDSDVNFILKGVAFILTGIGFGGANIFLLKKRGRAI